MKLDKQQQEGRAAGESAMGAADAEFFRHFVAYVRSKHPAGATPGTPEQEAWLFRRVVVAIRPYLQNAGAAFGGQAAKFEAAKAYMEKHFATATTEDVSKAVGLSHFHFHHAYTVWAGQTPKAFMSELQIEHAKALLQENRLGLDEVAKECGFSHQSHFTSRFRLLVGTSPGRWRRTQQIAALDAMYDDDAKAAA